MRTKRSEIVQKLTADIESGRFAPEQPLPAELALAQRFGVARGTVRAALEALAGAGLIESVPRHGWHVRVDTRREYPLSTLDSRRASALRDVWLTWCSEAQLDGDAELHTWIGPAPSHVCEHLDIAAGTACATRRRVRTVDGVPWMTSTGFFPHALVAGSALDATGEGAAVDLQQPSPLGVLAELGHAALPERDQDRIGARAPTDDEAELLGTGRGVPVLTLCRTSTDAHGHLVRCTADVIAAHRLYLVIDHGRQA